MILATFVRPDSSVAIGVVRREQGTIVDLQASHVTRHGSPDSVFATMLDLIEGGPAALDRAREIEAGSVVSLPLASATLLAPVPRPPQMRDFSVFETHMKQAGAAMARIRAARTGDKGPLPTPADIVLPPTFYQQPVYYKCNRFGVTGPDTAIHWPAYSRKLDYELEMGIFLSRSGRDVAEKDAPGFIFGYTIFNDFSARDAQEIEMCCPFGPAKGKDFDGSSAIGPWIVTADEIADPYDLAMVARINGEEWSRGSTRDMVHGFEAMIAHVSRGETLQAGEFFGSGTVGGGSGLELDRWLEPGDVVELEVDGIGVLRNTITRE